MFLVNNGADKMKEDFGSIITPVGREFLSVKVE
jgi:hypothetical protein